LTVTLLVLGAESVSVTTALVVPAFPSAMDRSAIEIAGVPAPAAAENVTS
jgi:hypothetical protein